MTNLVNVKETITRQHRDGSWSFAIPRSFGGGTIIGGTKEPDNWSLIPLRKTRDWLLNAARNLKPGLLTATDPGETLCVVADIVGRRPTRHGGMRLEIERRPVNIGDKAVERCIIHAYGAGGRGFEISWGVARDATELVLSCALDSQGIRVRAQL